MQAPTPLNKYRLGKSSLKRLEGLHPELVAVIKLAITLTEQDFTVFEGLRTMTRQRELVGAGKSWTFNSRHLTGHAADLVPWIDGRARWDADACHKIWNAMVEAGDYLGTPIRWGGDWNQDNISDLTPGQDGTKFDGAHFELPRDLYPA